MAVVQYTFTHKQYIERHKTNNTQNNITILEDCGPCPVLASYTLAFALQPRKKHGKTSVRVAASKNIFHTLCHKRQDFIYKKLYNIKCLFLIFSTTFVRNIYSFKKNSARNYHNVYRYTFKVSVNLVRFRRNPNFSPVFSKYTQIQNFIKYPSQ